MLLTKLIYNLANNQQEKDSKGIPRCFASFTELVVDKQQDTEPDVAELDVIDSQVIQNTIR